MRNPTGFLGVTSAGTVGDGRGRAEVCREIQRVSWELPPAGTVGDGRGRAEVCREIQRVSWELPPARTVGDGRRRAEVCREIQRVLGSYLRKNSWRRA